MICYKELLAEPMMGSKSPVGGQLLATRRESQLVGETYGFPTYQAELPRQ